MINKEYSLPNLPERISIGLQEGFCNLKCPKCPVHGEGKNNIIKGKMDLNNVYKLLEEVKGAEVIFASEGYTEPLLQENFWEYLSAVKERGIKMNINTNGLLMTKEYAKHIVDLQIDCVFVSVDAMTPNVLKKVRGTDRLDRIREAVFTLLETRGGRLYPRIGVSFLAQQSNIFEKDEFIVFWIQYVDAIRVASLYLEKDNIDQQLIPKVRKPCSILYDTMLIHHNGDVPMCCWDGSGKTKVGNVFEQGIKGVWLGEKLQEVRHYHESGQLDKVPFCKNCNDWMRYDFVKEEVIDNILIRYSPLLVYYNRIDRLGTWKFGAGQKLKLNKENP